MGTEEEEAIEILSSQVLHKVMPMMEGQDDDDEESYSREVSSFDPNYRKNSILTNRNRPVDEDSQYQTAPTQRPAIKN